MAKDSAFCFLSRIEYGLVILYTIGSGSESGKNYNGMEAKK